MIISGFHAVAARIKREAGSIRELYVDQQRSDARMRDLLATAKQLGLKIHPVDTARLDQLAPQRRHQGVVAFADAVIRAVNLDDLLDALTEPPLLLLLDGVTDPRNLGACLRAADGAGVHAVIAPRDRSATLNEAAIQTASGAADSVPYVTVTNLSRTMTELRDRDITLVGATDEAPASLYQAQLPAALGMVLGAEGHGLRRLTREKCHQLVHIPMRGAVESLNVAVAAGVMLYEAVRQRSV